MLADIQNTVSIIVALSKHKCELSVHCKLGSRAFTGLSLHTFLKN